MYEKTEIAICFKKKYPQVVICITQIKELLPTLAKYDQQIMCWLMYDKRTIVVCFKKYPGLCYKSH